MWARTGAAATAAQAGGGGGPSGQDGATLPTAPAAAEKPEAADPGWPAGAASLSPAAVAVGLTRAVPTLVEGSAAEGGFAALPACAAAAAVACPLAASAGAAAAWAGISGPAAADPLAPLPGAPTDWPSAGADWRNRAFTDPLSLMQKYYIGGMQWRRCLVRRPAPLATACCPPAAAHSPTGSHRRHGWRREPTAPLGLRAVIRRVVQGTRKAPVNSLSRSRFTSSAPDRCPDHPPPGGRPAVLAGGTTAPGGGCGPLSTAACGNHHLAGADTQSGQGHAGRLLRGWAPGRARDQG